MTRLFGLGSGMFLLLLNTLLSLICIPCLLPLYQSIVILFLVFLIGFLKIEKWLACQSLDNKVVIYSVGDRIKLNKKKLFTGHIVAGYSCRPDFSTDGRFLMSGDSEGKMWFWDWKVSLCDLVLLLTCLYRRVKCLKSLKLTTGQFSVVYGTLTRHPK